MPRTIAVVMGGAMIAMAFGAWAQTPLAGLTRTDLQRHDLSVPGREAVQSRVELATYFVEKGKPLLIRAAPKVAADPAGEHEWNC